MEIQSLLDKYEISEVLVRYCRGLDRLDEATLHSVYHEDAVEDRGEALFVGRAQDYVGWALTMLAPMSVTQHCMLNILVDLNGDSANVESYVQAYHLRDAALTNGREVTASPTAGEKIKWTDGRNEILFGGRYLDRFERREGAWKIAYRKLITDWIHVQAAGDDWFRDHPNIYRGARIIDDSHLDSALHRRKTI